MSNGLQVFSGGGSVLLDTSDRLSRLHGRYVVSAAWNVQSGFVAVPGMQDDNTWFCFVSYANSAFLAQPIVMRVSSGGFNWDRFGATGPLNETVTVMRV